MLGNIKEDTYTALMFYRVVLCKLDRFWKVNVHSDSGSCHERILVQVTCTYTLAACLSILHQVFNDAVEALRISYRKMNPFCVPFATTNMGSAMMAMDLVSQS
jgi:hypothetical protein